MAGWFNKAKHSLAVGDLDFLSGTYKILLVTSGYVFNPDDDFVNGDVALNELSGTGYVGGFGGSGRKSLTNIVVTEDDANNRAFVDADDVTWSGINAGTVAAAVLYKLGSNDADSVLIAYIDGGFPKVTNGGDLVIQWSNAPQGILELV